MRYHPARTLTLIPVIRDSREDLLHDRSRSLAQIDEGIARRPSMRPVQTAETYPILISAGTQRLHDLIFVESTDCFVSGPGTFTSRQLSGGAVPIPCIFIG